MMRIKTLSIPVLDQAKALKFYTEILGLKLKTNIDVGGGNKWLTVESSQEENGAEILLEPAPLHFEPSRIYQKAIKDAGLPVAQLEVDDVEKEYERLTDLGVSFSVKPTSVGTAAIAILDDTCGNFLQLVQIL
ncbi:MAG: VOC family protein [Saprospiraceae bacterium]|nr:VOC family protein [Saprospiraceae bacterium]